MTEEVLYGGPAGGGMSDALPTVLRARDVRWFAATIRMLALQEIAIVAQQCGYGYGSLEEKAALVAAVEAALDIATFAKLDAQARCDAILAAIKKTLPPSTR